MIASFSENYHRYFFQYHFSLLQRVAEKSLNKILQLIRKTLRKTSKMALDVRYQSAVSFSLHCIMGDSDAKFAGHIGKVFKVCVYKYCGVIFLFQDVLF